MRFWPFVSRALHQERVNVLTACVDALKEAIEIKNEQIVRRDAEIKALLETIANHKCNHYTSKDLLDDKKPSQPKGVRSNWRARAKSASILTIPKPQDSVEALEQRVVAEGGKV